MADYGIRLNADASGLVGGTEKSAAALKGVEDQAKKTSQAFAEMSRASRTAADDQRRLNENYARSMSQQATATNVQRMAFRESTTAVGELDKELTRYLSTTDKVYRAQRQLDIGQDLLTRGMNAGLLTQRQHDELLGRITAKTDTLVRSNSELAGGLQQVWERKSKVSAIVTALLHRFGGPVGIIATLGTAALAWVGFGEAAERGAAKAEAAAKKARDAAAQMTERQRGEQEIGRLAAEVQQYSAERSRLEAKLAGGGLLPEERQYLPARIAAIQAGNESRARRIAELTWPKPPAAVDVSIEEATKGLRTATSTRREFDERVAKLYAAYGPAIQRSEDPAALQAELLENYQSAQRAYESTLKTGAGGRTGAGADNGAAARRAEAEALRAEAEAARELARELKALTASAQLQVTLEERQGEVMGRTNQTWSERSQALELELSLMDADAATREKAIAFRRIDLDLQRASVDLAPEQIEALRALADAEKSRLEVLIDGKAAREWERKVAETARRSAQEAAAEWKRASDNIERSLTDALMRGFDSGKTFAQNLRDSLAAMFKTLVLEPIIRPIAQTGASMLMGALGMPGSANAGGGVGGIGNVLSGANSLFGGGGMGFGGALEYGAGFASTAFTSSAASAAMIEAGTVGFAGAGMEAGALGMGAMGAASVIPWVGAALLAAQALGLFDEGGGPKPSQIMLQGDPGSFNVGQADTPGGWGNLPLYQSVAGAFNDPAQYDPAMLAQLKGRWIQGAPGESAESMVDKLLASLEPARTAAQQQLQVQQQLLAAQQQANASLSSMAQSLPQALGIDVLQSEMDRLAVAPDRAPLDRFAAAKAQLEERFAAAKGGDLDAVRSFPQVLEQARAIGMEVYASGPQFQALNTEATGFLRELLDTQKGVQVQMLGDVSVSVIQAGKDTVRALGEGFAEMKAKLADIDERLRTMPAMV